MPAVPSYPIIGTLWNYLPFVGQYDVKKLHEASVAKYEKYGEIVKEKHPGNNSTLVHLFNPDDIETMFRHEGKYPVRPLLGPLREYREMRKEWFRNGGILTLDGEEWQSFRSKVQQHMLKPKAVLQYVPSMEAVAKDMIGIVECSRDDKQEVLDLVPLLGKWALESTAIVAMDTRLGCLDPGVDENSEAFKLVAAVNSSMDDLFKLLMRSEFSKNFPSLVWRRFTKTMDFTSMIALKYVDQALERIKSKKLDEDSELTVLELMLLEKDFEQKDAITMTVDMLIAGIDTTSHSAAYILYHLAKNSEAQRKAFEEVSKISYDDLQAAELGHLPYLRACLKESMRLNPVFNNTWRQIDHNVTVSGYEIPSGTILICQNSVASRLEKYFPKPETFRPERWLKDSGDKHNPFLVLPFGFGPRTCIGQRIAMQELLILLIKVLQKYKLEYHHEDIGVYTRFANVPDRPLHIRFLPRS